MATKTKAEVPTYEAARDELLATVRKLEDGGLPLEESLALWERGEELARICQSWLDGARERLAGHRPGDGDGPDHRAKTTDDTADAETGSGS